MGQKEWTHQFGSCKRTDNEGQIVFLISEVGVQMISFYSRLQNEYADFHMS